MFQSLILLLLFLHAASSLPNFLIVQTSYGAVRGYEHRAETGFVGEIFKKIPYASPPIGEMRWKKPVPPEPWNYTRDGTYFGPACAQVPGFWDGIGTGFSEDCLTLNIYTSRGCRESTSSCPVLHFIHGSVNLYGGALQYSDESLVTKYVEKGIVLVTIAYRLGVFGVLALGDENALPANLVLHDVVQSLRFVHKEIQNFGGDKNKISLMGYSSGAALAFLLATSPGINKVDATPLFNRAIIISGSAVFFEESDMMNRSRLVTSSLGCSGSAQEIIGCLRPLSTEKILDAASKIGGSDLFSETQLSSVILSGELMPIHDIKELMEIPKQTKLLLGSTLQEFEFGGGMINARFERDSAAENQNNLIIGVQNWNECSQKYIRDVKSGKFEPGYNMLSQSVFLTNGMYARAQARAGREVYLYQLDFPDHVHGDDLRYLMGSHKKELDINEVWLNRVYSLYIANFVKGLTPAPDWEAVNPELMNYYSINKSFVDDVSPTMILGYHRNLMEYYDNMKQFDEGITEIKRKISNTPVQYKNALIFFPERWKLIDIILFSTVTIFLSFLAFRSCQLWRQRTDEKKPLLIGYIM